MDIQANHALIRFGLGRKGTEPLPSDPQSWLAAQLDGPDHALDTPGASAQDGLAALQEMRQDKTLRGRESPAAVIFKAERDALFSRLLTSDAPFRERLVLFWYNHFTVSLKRGECTAVVNAFIREAIRPHVTGRFSDMAMAVMRHPAMLLYLDNAQSIGPNSPVGLRLHKGLNENLARECLELHTVTPSAGYTQSDVTNFAKLLTGWSLELKTPPRGFRFRPMAHEPDGQVVLGQHFPPGEPGGASAIGWLAQHPATYRNLAVKLVRHFVADDPPTAAVQRIAAVLTRTHGDLKAASLELTRLPEAWQPLSKIRSPVDYVLAVLRAADLPPDKQPPDVFGLIANLGQPLFAAPLPNGWPDTASEWAGSEALLRRVDWVHGFVGRLGGADAMQIADATLGPLLSDSTKREIGRAGSRQDALTLLFASPEFLRR
ncbi:MAG: DUF1800 domain-containing protein [Acetobacteraceae bacterium]|nr:DUF1800 domain-containing protein [Acetobacteraceae bacterium]